MVNKVLGHGIGRQVFGLGLEGYEVDSRLENFVVRVWLRFDKA